MAGGRPIQHNKERLLGLRDLFTRRRTANVPAAAPFVPEPTEPEQPTPAQVADLEAAWAELRHVVEETGATSLRACTRDGSSWETNPAAVRAITAAIRSVQN